MATQLLYAYKPNAVQAKQLRIEADRCFRIAQGADPKLYDELQEIGREFERKADELDTGAVSGDAW